MTTSDTAGWLHDLRSRCSYGIIVRMSDEVNGVPLPGELVELPPGPRLAAALAQVDPATLNGYDLVELASVYMKQISHLQAGLASVLNHAQHTPPGDPDAPAERSEHVNRWAELELAARLCWSAGKASYELRYAHQLTRRLPVVHAALAAGLIDWPRARIIIDVLACLDDEPAAQLAADILTAGAPGWNTRQLSERLRRQVIAHDPQAAARRQRQRLADRWVQADPHPDGVSNLYAMHLPPQRVAEIIERITALARAAKRAGDQRSLDQLRADALCDLLAGTGVGATPPEPVTDPDPAPADRSSDPVDPAQADADPAGGDDPRDGNANSQGPAEPGLGNAAETGFTTAGLGDTPTPDDPLSNEAPSDEVPGDEAGGDEAGGDAPGRVVPLPGPRRGVVELSVPLSTLIEMSQAPGHIAGYGPVIADICRQITAESTQAQWRYSIYDDLISDGQLAFHGITHARPVPAGQDGSGFSAADTAFLRARDRTCRGPQGCHAPASGCDLDHTVAKVDGGGHHRGNGGPLCRRCHMFKHQSGADLRQPEPGVFAWTTPFGHRYVVRPEPYDESTGPRPPAAIPRQRLARLFSLAA